MKRSVRLRSIRTPLTRDRIAPSKRDRADEGPTAFALLRRAELLGETVVCNVKTKRVTITGRNDGRATTSALSLLYHRDKITQAQFRAGLMYARLRFAWFGSAVPRGSSLASMIHEHLSSDSALADAEDESAEDKADRLEEMRLDFRRGDDRLRKLPYYERVRVCLRAVCIDDLYPTKRGWLDRLRIGLQELADTWRTDQW